MRGPLAVVGALALAMGLGLAASAHAGPSAKPAPGMLLAFADRFGLDPAAVLMVGDSRHDLIAARAAGMPAVGVLTGTAAAEDLAPLALAVLPDIGHLPGWLRRGAAA